MPNISRAFKESILEDLIIKRVTTSRQPNTLICGRISLCDENYIYIQITEGIEELLPWNAKQIQLFDVVFYKNRTTHQLQHSALDYVKKHKLFGILINNPNFERNEYQLGQLPAVQSLSVHEHKLR